MPDTMQILTEAIAIDFDDWVDSGPGAMLTISQGEGHTRAWAEISEKIDKSESPQDLMLIYRDNLYRSKRSVKARIQQLGLDEIDFDFEVDWTWPI